MALKKKPDKSWNNIELDIQRESRALFHFERSRLNHLFIEAVRYPLVVVCAGAGYGKTSAVHDFVKEYQAPTAWIQLSERDNIGSRFWENYVHTMGLVDLPFSKAVRKIGFPDTVEKLDQFMEISREFSTSLEKRIIVLDDFHYIEDPLVIRFVERVIQNLSISSMFIISRSTPRLNIAGLVSNGRLFNISESDLRFTEDELAQYFRRQNISTQPDSLREIMHDTEGWAFAINLIARSFQKAPGYGGYLRSAMKTNIFNVMESEIWSGISERVQLFLICLSLIDHLSYDLITLLAGGDDGLIADLERQSAYIRRDSYINAYLLHPLFLEFLAAKQGFLSEEQKRETYSIAGNWCNENGFKIDALFYYEKIGDYASIVALFHALPVQLPYDIPKYATAIFERAPEEAFDTVVTLGIAHARCYVRLGRWDRAIELIKFYEEKYLKLPKNDVFRNRNLGGIYLLWGYFRSFMCLNDNVFDFDHYFEKFIKVHPQPASLTKYVTRIRVVGPWIIA
ncbi:MAG: hypothetical protein LBU66_06955, partial [Treponema sp.]|nr:hypothetical protein [Treponema sp.]